MNKGIYSRALFVLIAVSAAIAVIGCQMPGQPTDDNIIPEAKTADWKKLRALVADYETCRADVDQQTLLVVQNGFRRLIDANSSNRIGDEAYYYVGRIYYDIRDYHDARTTFNKHKEFYPQSEFGPTIARLEAEMDKDVTRHREWLDQTRTSTTAY